jgi:hypothetical protein
MADDGRGGVVRGGHWNRDWNAPVAVFRLLDRHFGLDRLVLSRLVAHLSFFKVNEMSYSTLLFRLLLQTIIGQHLRPNGLKRSFGEMNARSKLLGSS